VAEDEVRLRNDLDTIRAQRFNCFANVVDFQVDQRTRRALFK
jgi:hypothetical protein